jgi:hypothetical protein
MRSTAVVALLFLLVAADLRGQDNPAWTEQHGAFAFPDAAGTRLLSTADISTPELLRTALCSGDRRLAVRFERRQAESVTSSHRQAPHNFDNTAGSVFRIVDAKVDPAATCFLAVDSFLAGATPVRLGRAADGSRCARDLYPHFGSAKSRPVVGCWPIAQSPTTTRVVLIEFARRLRYALASLAVVDGDTRMYLDYPADFTGPGADLWRVDDGGEIHAEDFEIVFLMTRGAAYVMAVAWSGAEGIALSLVTAEGDSDFRQVIGDSWYRSPL